MPRLISSNGKKVVSGQTKIAHVVSGGGMKSLFYQMGVAMCFENKRFRYQGGLLDSPTEKLLPRHQPGTNIIDMIVGSSAGSEFGIGPALGHSARDMYELFMSDELLKKRGFARGVWKYIDTKWDAVPQLVNFGKAIPKALGYDGNWRSLRKVFGHTFSPMDFIRSLNIESMTIKSPFVLTGLERRLDAFLRTDNVFEYKNDFRWLDCDFFVVTTPLNRTGRIVYSRRPFEANHRITYRNDLKISTAIAASSSLQCFHPLRATHFNGEEVDLVDGETRKTLSYKIAGDNGADLVFVSYTHVPFMYDPSRSIADHGMGHIDVQSLYLMIEEKILTSKESTEAKNKTYHKVKETFERAKRDHPGELEVICEVEKEIMEVMMIGMNMRPGIEYVFINPESTNQDFFFSPHMYMGQKYIEKMAKQGYEDAERVLKGYEFRFGLPKDELPFTYKSAEEKK
ncbi:patatin-like phospholipase family protein [Candidatus Woesearchaeota archaeon]|jgi:predicted acylesterase/phospholipase RssA|nr:patatin-like phospholipase family protein [Candidatus Woesearchaeota archaeon]MBT5271974.1 patatin-like phospholipase family protein [Candidatus Woesearchaeota archaeon]MBT6040906.1 patatin-like phospholipase family protein [Candidatus Woesearchaeota archaeon]MBT6336756.1 patatin-like phospholipase family protein [Candidatus Woesearchaeota archaeon]MBT7927223.1 patatin-like phospholipase family protein [Candidatus Woesearchaeota archaeon]